MRRRRLPAVLPRLTAAIPHIPQIEHWDCGLACLSMVLHGAYSSGLIADDPDTTSPARLRALLAAAGAGDSIWTIDLAYILRHFGVEDFTFYTSYIGVNFNYSSKHFYRENITVDRQRVHTLFAEAQDCGVRVVPVVLSLDDMRRFLLSDRYAIVILVNLNKLKCRLCSKSSLLAKAMSLRANGSSLLGIGAQQAGRRPSVVAMLFPNAARRGSVAPSTPAQSSLRTEPSEAGVVASRDSGLEQPPGCCPAVGVFFCFPCAKPRVEEFYFSESPELFDGEEYEESEPALPGRGEKLRIRLNDEREPLLGEGGRSGKPLTRNFSTVSSVASFATALASPFPHETEYPGSGILSGIWRWLVGGTDDTMADLEKSNEDVEKFDKGANGSIEDEDEDDRAELMFAAAPGPSQKQPSSSPAKITPLKHPRVPATAELDGPVFGSPPGVGVRHYLGSSPASVTHLPPNTILSLKQGATESAPERPAAGTSPSRTPLVPVIESIPAALATLLGSPVKDPIEPPSTTTAPPGVGVVRPLPPSLAAAGRSNSASSNLSSSTPASPVMSPRMSTSAGARSRVPSAPTSTSTTSTSATAPAPAPATLSALPSWAPTLALSPFSLAIASLGARPASAQAPAEPETAPESDEFGKTSSFFEPSDGGPADEPEPHRLALQPSSRLFNVTPPPTPAHHPRGLPAATAGASPSQTIPAMQRSAATANPSGLPSLPTTPTSEAAARPPGGGGSPLSRAIAMFTAGSGNPAVNGVAPSPVASSPAAPSPLANSRGPRPASAAGAASGTRERPVRAFSTGSPPPPPPASAQVVDVTPPVAQAQGGWEALSSALLQPLQLAGSLIRSAAQGADKPDVEGRKAEEASGEPDEATREEDTATPVPAETVQPADQVGTTGIMSAVLNNVLGWTGTRSQTASPVTPPRAAPAPPPPLGGRHTPPSSTTSSVASTPSRPAPPAPEDPAPTPAPGWPAGLLGSIGPKFVVRKFSIPGTRDDAPPTSVLDAPRGDPAAAGASASAPPTLKRTSSANARMSPRAEPAATTPAARSPSGRRTSVSDAVPARKASAPGAVAATLQTRTSFSRSAMVTPVPPATSGKPVSAPTTPAVAALPTPSGIAVSPATPAAPPPTPSVSAAAGSPTAQLDEFVGHYVVLVGYDPETDGFLVRDPGTEEGLCFVDAGVLDVARGWAGTDHDAIVVRVR
ncbi:guanylyl cyclase domain-containing protein 1 [Phlyctochytrium bullatum]|nr:guanylyl cyclase domain-containing protein 1 [Phlyctochytrium bullatum]